MRAIGTYQCQKTFWCLGGDGAHWAPARENFWNFGYTSTIYMPFLCQNLANFQSIWTKFLKISVIWLKFWTNFFRIFYVISIEEWQWQLWLDLWLAIFLLPRENSECFGYMMHICMSYSSQNLPNFNRIWTKKIN